MPVGNFITALDVTPGEDFAVRLSHDSWPDPWPDETAFIFMSPQAMLRVPCYADGASIVVELNATETLFPQVGVGWSLSAWHNGQMLRVASGQLRRPN